MTFLGWRRALAFVFATALAAGVVAAPASSEPTPPLTPGAAWGSGTLTEHELGLLVSQMTLAEKDAQLAAMAERLASMEALLEQRTTPEAAPDAEVAELRAELDAKGIAYDKRWAAPKLRQALAGEAA